MNFKIGNQILLEDNFKILIIHNPSLGSCEVQQKKIGPNLFSRFDVYWIQTNRQTNKMTDKPNLYIDKRGFVYAQFNPTYLKTYLSRYMLKSGFLILKEFI